MVTNNIAEVMRAMKEARGVSYKQISRDTGIPDGTIKSWLVGEARIPFDKAVTIMGYLGYKVVFVKKQRGRSYAGKSQ